ncbi:MAG: c-type cytochrome [Candidatus Krumholzibacteriia bacterium]
MPRPLVNALIVLFALGLVPLAIIARDRVTPSPRTRIQIIPDMDKQPKFRTQRANPFFADGRAMRLPPPDTVARGEARTDSLSYAGRENGAWATRFPQPVTPAVMARGRERFRIYCSPCHGLAGYGDGLVAQRADRLQEGTWTPPASFHTDELRQRAVGRLFDTITNGVRSMPSYGAQIPPADRWAIVAYVRALQRSQHAGVADVPPAEQPALR